MSERGMLRQVVLRVEATESQNVGMLRQVVLRVKLQSVRTSEC